MSSKGPGRGGCRHRLLIGQPQIQITVDRAAIARYGLAVADMQNVVATAIGGQAATQVLEGERSFDLVVKMSPNPSPMWNPSATSPSSAPTANGSPWATWPRWK
jgi:multidrug efflux pump subunit AcrB